MKPILALETSTTLCGVAIYSADSAVETLFEQEVDGVSGHARNIFPLIDVVLRQAGLGRGDLNAVAFGCGPGGFTGVRLGCSIAQGMSYALGVPVVQVGALPAVANALRQRAPQGIRLVALDARMNEMYLAAYGPVQTAVSHSPVGQELQSPVLLRADDCARFVAERLPYWLRAAGGTNQVTLAGQGWDLVALDALALRWQHGCSELVLHRDTDVTLPQVAEIARLGYQLLENGLYVDPAYALPLYLRDKVAFTTDERAQGLGGNPQAHQSVDLLLLPMSEVDVPEVVALERQSQAFPWSEQNFIDSLRAGYPAWVVRQGAALLGFCVGMVAPEEVHVLVIAVSQQTRRQGLGSLLLTELDKVAQQSGAARILLEVRPSNVSAIDFYRQHDFAQVGLRRGYYQAEQGRREDAVVMAKDLHDEPISRG